MTTLRDVLTRAGFTGAGLSTAEAVAEAESGGNARAHNGNAATGDNSYGLFQINMLGAMGPERRSEFHLPSNASLFDPETNARVAYALSKHGTDWSPWSTFKSGAYRRFLGGDAAVTDAPAGPSSSSSSSSSATPAVFGLPSPSSLAASATKLVVITAALAAGAGLVVLGLNKASGNPAGKATAGLPGLAGAA